MSHKKISAVVRAENVFQGLFSLYRGDQQERLVDSLTAGLGLSSLREHFEVPGGFRDILRKHQRTSLRLSIGLAEKPPLKSAEILDHSRTELNLLVGVRGEPDAEISSIRVDELKRDRSLSNLSTSHPVDLYRGVTPLMSGVVLSQQGPLQSPLVKRSQGYIR